MRPLRSFLFPLLAIAFLIVFSVITVVSVGESFKVLGIRKDGIKLSKRDGSTISFDLPWKSAHDHDTADAKAISPIADGLLGAISNIAGALLNDGTNIVAQVPSPSDASPLASTVLAAASGLTAVVPTATNLQDLNIAVSQGDGIVNFLVSDAAAIVGSILAGMSGASNIGVLSVLPTPITASVSGAIGVGGSILASVAGASVLSILPTSTALSVSDATGIVRSIPASILGASNTGVLSNLLTPTTTSEPQEFLPQSTLHSSSTTISSQQQNITSAPSLNNTIANPTSTAGSLCPPPTTCTLCPLAQTETCTVTERWHLTKYEETATFFSFADVYTVTCTETINICPSLGVIMPTPSSSVIACANGDIVKREEDCLLPTSDTIPSRTHPCPNEGYSCSECPDNYFCPPQQTPAQSCPCGYGWACAHCSQDWFCIPSPSSVNLSPITSVASLLGNVTLVPNSTASLTATVPLKTSAPNLSAIATALGLSLPSATSSALPTSSILDLSAAASAISQVNSAVGGVASGLTGNNVINAVVGEVVSALGNVSGLSGDMLAQVITILASVNAAPGNIIPTNLASELANIPPTNPASDLANFPPRLIPLPTLAREMHTQTRDTVRHITTLQPVVTTITVMRTVQPVPADVLAAPGIVDEANGGGLKVKGREARKEG